MRSLALAAVAAAGLAFSAAAEQRLVIEVAGKGAVEIELFDDAAPLHAERLRTLARDGAYDGVAFHRVIEGFMAQTGDVEHGTRDAHAAGRAGTGGSDLPDLPAEFSDISFERGVVGMARSQDPDSANSQFFIMFASAPHLDGQYTAVGQVVEGMEVVDSLARGAGPSGAVRDPDYMERVRVE
jgi:peptidylprolyl isomerase